MTTTDDLAAIRAAGLMTGRYATFRPEHGVPVRTSVGRPRYWRHGELPHSRACSPYGVFRNAELELSEQEAAYRLNLAAQAEQVLYELADIARAHPGRPLVLLCYEDDPAQCHRSWLAAWLSEQFDLIVTEVAT